MGLEDILRLLGADKPFDDNGNYTEDGIKAQEKLLDIVDGLKSIGALGKTGDQLEAYLDEIVRLGF